MSEQDGLIGAYVLDGKGGFLAIAILLAAVVALQVLIFRRLKWI